MIEFIDKSSIEDGTPLNRKNMMGLQGFHNATIQFNNDGSITEINGDGHTTTTTFNADGTITTVFVGEKTITKKTVFNDDGSITEVVL